MVGSEGVACQSTWPLMVVPSRIVELTDQDDAAAACTARLPAELIDAVPIVLEPVTDTSSVDPTSVLASTI